MFLDSSNLKKALRANYKQIYFVCLAFALMVAISGFSMSSIINKKSLLTVNTALNESEKTIHAYLHEPKIAFENIYATVKNMLDKNASQQEIVEYLTQTTNLLKTKEYEIKGFSFVYGYIRGEPVSGLKINLSSEYILQQRDWYKAAMKNEGTTYTAPYRDANTGGIVISIVRRLYGANGEDYGVLSMDVDIAWLMDYSKDLVFADGGYGMIVNQFLYILAHPQEKYKNLPLQELGSDYKRITDILRADKGVSAEFIQDYDNTAAIVFFKQLSNEWFVGVVIPVKSYYSDLYFSLFLLAALGTVFAFILCYILLHLSAARIQSDEANKSKSSFLARMSHEMRTPMNAIIGLSELTLREDVSNRVQEHVFTIKQAGSNLLSIINDILDFSKIESGKLEIIPADYIFASLANDVINIIRMKIVGSQTQFVVNIDSNIPHILFGDETRIRQVLLNILGNAVKYTEKGFISFSVSGKSIGSDAFVFTIEVEDSGIGIKEEDLGNLFSEFAQFDVIKHKDVEGTGLGLSITKSLVNAMGGKISVSSKYGEGSKFTVELPQKVHDSKKMVSIENADKNIVLIYEPCETYAKSISWTMENLNVKHALVFDNSEFYEKIITQRYSFIFIAASSYEKAEQLISNSKSEAKVVLLAEFGQAAMSKNLSTLTMPVSCISVAGVLNGNTGDFNLQATGESVAKFVAPKANILIVDDINTNLIVAEGLMRPYEMQIDTCFSGKEAIEKIKAQKYDLVFMDHMMPEMDGVEATKLIRKLDEEYYRSVPIIALTANAISEAKDMFLSNGFNDFLSKPIDIVKLNTILSRWLPKEKQGRPATKTRKAKTEKNNAIFISGIDAKSGIARLGGNVKNYLQTLGIFQKDGLEKAEEMKKSLEDGDVSLYAIHVHALKSASANVGAIKLSEAAKELEAAARREDYFYIQKQNPKFLADLETLLKSISEYLKAGIKNDKSDKSVDSALLKTKLSELKAALGSMDITTINKAAEFLQGFTSTPDIGGAIDKVLQNVLIGEYEEAERLIEGLISAHFISSNSQAPQA